MFNIGLVSMVQLAQFSNVRLAPRRLCNIYHVTIAVRRGAETKLVPPPRPGPTPMLHFVL